MEQPHQQGRPAWIVWTSAEAPQRLVAGLPAIARLVHILSEGGYRQIYVTGASSVGTHVLAEIERLRGNADVEFIGAAPAAASHRYSGAFLPSIKAVRHWRKHPGPWLHHGQPVAWTGDENPLPASGSCGPADVVPMRDADPAVLRTTAKPSDGIVSRYLNRPVSRMVSRIMLAVPGACPVHATMLVAAVAILMFLCLVSGEPAGLVLGGILFHAASVLDGVDGEMSRATFRSSERGARLDTGVDMVTNLAFVCGIAINLALAGREVLAITAAAGLGVLAVGILLLAIMVNRDGNGSDFNYLKDKVLSSGNRAGWVDTVRNIAAFATSRDFFAFFFMMMFLLGLEEVVVPMFTVSAMLWLIFVMGSAIMLWRYRKSAETAAEGAWQAPQPPV